MTLILTFVQMVSRSRFSTSALILAVRRVITVKLRDYNESWAELWSLGYLAESSVTSYCYHENRCNHSCFKEATPTLVISV